MKLTKQRVFLITVFAGLIIVVLFAVLNILKNKRAVSLRMERGREIWKGIFGETFTREANFIYTAYEDECFILPRTYIFPSARDIEHPLFTNSTDYFTNIYDRFLKHGVAGGMNLKWMNPSSFTLINNEWCIVANTTFQSELYLNTPLLFTKNLSITNLSDPVDNALTDNPPFGKRGVVIITHGGGALFLNQEELIKYWKTFSATNTVLRP